MSTEDLGMNSASGSNSSPADEDEIRRAAAILLERYYYQLREGCGNSVCNNPHCASSGKVGTLSGNEAAARAVHLFSIRAVLCDSSGKRNTKLNQLDGNDQNFSKENITKSKSSSRISPDPDYEMELFPAFSELITSSSNSLNKSVNFSYNPNIGLTEERLRQTLEDCKNSNHYASLRILLRTIFSNESALKCSFLTNKYQKTKQLPLKEISNFKDKRKNEECEINLDDFPSEVSLKDQPKSIECDKDKDPDSLLDNNDQIMADGQDVSFISNCNTSSTLDLESLRRSYKMLFEVPEHLFSSTLMDAIRQLMRDSLSIQLKVSPQLFKTDSSITNVFIILLENPNITSTEYTEEVLGDICKVMSQLEISQQAILVNHLTDEWDTPRLHRFLESLHQLITIRLLTTEFSQDFIINDETSITAATSVMKIVYYAAICSGKLDYPLLTNLPPEQLPPISSQDRFTGAGKSGLSKPPPWDPLSKHLGIHPLDCRVPSIPFEDFYDDFLSDQLEIDKDFTYFKTALSSHYSFLASPFILTPATKALGLYYDNRIRMYSERRISFYQSFMEGLPANPYLTLRIGRDSIISDALIELEFIATENPVDLKKQLVVEFKGEQGIDEGGVSKEFFQLIIEQLFNPDYAMFCLTQETQTFWFNPTSFESDAQFTLVGIVLGLAIYNNVILDLHFPPVLYKKLCGKPGSFHDLESWNPTLYRGLVDLLNYTEDDMEDVFMQTFRVGYNDVFGASLHHDLKYNGDNIVVNQHNKEEFVTMYADFLLNKNVERQFFAFRRGFNMVMEDSPLHQLFRPHELELLVCGSQHYDFSELKKTTEYDGGYSADSPIICWFWELVNQLDSEEKKELLQFTTGSARVPVGGLARLKLVIARHGPDTDRLPTAHTCFNVLLLPEYSSKEKLRERLLKAIKYAQGFGML